MIDPELERRTRTTSTLTVATLRRELRSNFFAFVDYSLRWNSMGDEFLSDDGTIALVEAFHCYQQWSIANCGMPRGVGKTTIECLGFTWLHWRHPWLQSLLISAVGDVTADVHEFMAHLWTEHPIIWEIRPRSVRDQQKDIDLPTRRSKGRSFRARTTGKRVTGGRRHLCAHDDIEVEETVRTQRQRMRIRRTMAEAHNLSFKNHPFDKTITVGTPWDPKSVIRNSNSDWPIEIPAYIVKEDGSTIFPYDRLPPEELERLRRNLADPVLFESQYGLTFEGLERRRPFSVEMMNFDSFEAARLDNLTALVDPAGGRMSQTEREAIRLGKRRGDGLTLIVGGTHKHRLYIVDIFSEPIRGDRFLEILIEWQKRYGFYEVAIEQNNTGWDTMIEMAFQREHIPCSVEPFPTTQNKHSKIISALVPLMSIDGMIFHERLSHYPKLIDPEESQFLQITYADLGENDDVPDACAMLANRLREWLYYPEDQSDAELDRLKKRHAPDIVIEHRDQIGRTTNRIAGRDTGIGTIVETGFDPYD